MSFYLSFSMHCEYLLYHLECNNFHRKFRLIDPLGRPIVPAGSDFYFHMCCPSVSQSALFKISQNKTNVAWKKWSLLLGLWVWPRGSLMAHNLIFLTLYDQVNVHKVRSKGIFHVALVHALVRFHNVHHAEYGQDSILWVHGLHGVLALRVHTQQVLTILK